MAGHCDSMQFTAVTTSGGLQKSHCSGHVHNNSKLVTASLANEETETRTNTLLAQITKGRAGPGSRMIVTAATVLGPYGQFVTSLPLMKS